MSAFSTTDVFAEPLAQTIRCDMENKRLDYRSWMGWCHVNYLDQWWVLLKRK
jgi:hypothetical protein